MFSEKSGCGVGGGRHARQLSPLPVYHCQEPTETHCEWLTCVVESFTLMKEPGRAPTETLVYHVSLTLVQTRLC